MRNEEIGRGDLRFAAPTRYGDCKRLFLDLSPNRHFIRTGGNPDELLLNGTRALYLFPAYANENRPEDSYWVNPRMQGVSPIFSGGERLDKFCGNRTQRVAVHSLQTDIYFGS